MSPSRVSTLDFSTFYNVVNAQNRSSKNIHHGVNPATGEELWDCPIGTEQDLDDAVDAAKVAFPAWSQTPIERRKELLNKFGDLFNQHTEEFVELLCKESGKPKQFATIEVSMVKGFIEYHCTLDIPTEKFEDEEKTIYTEYMPLGVCGKA
jgi:acyl-CoA reductase-like NAD-dependent aldehyde dehydrogenase